MRKGGIVGLLFLSRKMRDEYAEANAIVAQALDAVKTVYSFTAERRIVGSYVAVLEKAIGLGVRQGTAKGLAVGFTGLSFAIWGFLAWYSSRLVMFHGESGGRIYAAGIAFVLGGLYV
uniref:ABC transmembrane type-1 domain-containing protein n=1 Tax=Ananas comosus var. bracteatus TaxID=296719 RepID=A0A6V7QUX4_ANACO